MKFLPGIFELETRQGIIIKSAVFNFILNHNKLFICLSIILITSQSCDKKEETPLKFPPPSIETNPISKVGRIIKSGGYILNDGGTKITSKGLCWSTMPYPTLLDSFNTDTSSEYYFYSSLTRLLPSTTYYIRAWATNAGGTSYDNEKVVTTVSFQTLVAGDNYGGGKLLYIFRPGDPGYSKDTLHGIVAAPFDLSSKALWGCPKGIADGNGWNQTMDNESLGKGKANTERIILLCGNIGSAANLCDELKVNGYDDWYFPSIAELSMLCSNREAIGEFKEGYYWSSTWYYEEFLPTYIWFHKGIQRTGNQPLLTWYENVRPIRYF